MPSMSLQWFGRSKVKLRVRVVWSVHPLDLEPLFCMTRKKSRPSARVSQRSPKTVLSLKPSVKPRFIRKGVQ